MNKAVFLDRDGIINREIGDYVTNIDDFEFNNGIVDSIKLLKDNDYLVIVITNQGGISKGIFSLDDFQSLNNYMLSELKKMKADIDEVYYCPHHPDVTKCLCRKPEPLMIEKAIARFNIDREKSYMIGDAPRDVLAAERAGVKGILVEPNTNLLEIVKGIIQGSL
jgi:D-glycero-D-manno-heptose 1,7-bisphosphate phosphatase